MGGFPKLPDWLQERAYLSIDFCDVTQHGQEVGVSLGSLPVALQQHAVVQDFLYLMSGVSGRCGCGMGVVWSVELAVFSSPQVYPG